MSMAYKDTLYELVRACNASEKRYIKIYSSAFKYQSGLLKLFESLARAIPPTEETQKKALGRANLNMARSDLRKLILKAMRSFHDSDSRRADQRNSLADIEFLQSKLLFDEAEKEIRKTYRRLGTLAEPLHELELLLKENELVASPKDPDDFESEFEQRTIKVRAITARLVHISELLIINRKWGQHIGLFNQGDYEMQGKHFDSLSHSIVRILQESDDPMVKVMALSILSHGYGIQKRTSDSDHAATEAIELYDRFPYLKELRFVTYFSLMFNLASSHYLRDEDEHSLRLIEKLWQEQRDAERVLLKDYPDHLRARHRFALLSGKLRALCASNRHGEAVPLIKEYDSLVQDGMITTNTNTEHLIQLRLASVEFHALNARMARKRIQGLLTDKSIKDNHKLYSTLLISEAVCSRAMGNLVQFETQVENLLRVTSSLSEDQVIGPNVRLLLRKLTRFDGSELEKDKILALTATIEADQEHKSFKEFTDLVLWARSVVGRTDCDAL